jgi:hypothetical protein
MASNTESNQIPPGVVETIQPHVLNYTISGRTHAIPCSNLLAKSNYNPDGTFHVSEKQHQICSDLKVMLEWFKSFAKHNNLIWVATAGTLLGAVRHGGLIPWDNDLDISMYCTDAKYAEIRRRCGEYGKFKIMPAACGFRVYYIHKSFPFMDIWVYGTRDADDTTMENVKSDKVEYIGPIREHNFSKLFYLGDLYPKYWLNKSDFDIDNIIVSDFEGIEIPIHQNSEMILKRWYGESCLNELYLDDHVDVHDGIDVDSGDTIVSTLEQMIGLFKLDPYLGNMDPEKSNANLSKLLIVVGDKLVMHDSAKSVNDQIQIGKAIMGYFSTYIAANKKLIFEKR